MQISVLQSLLAHQRTAINELHSQSKLFKDVAKLHKATCPEDVNFVEELFKESERITKKIAKRVKIQKALKKQIAFEIAVQWVQSDDY